MAKAKEFRIPGLFGELSVKLVTRRTINKRAGKPAAKGTVVNGLYLDSEHSIYIASELEGHARVTTLMHEVAHHVLDSTDELDEERRCDIIGAYLLKLNTETEVLKVIQELERA